LPNNHALGVFATGLILKMIENISRVLYDPLNETKTMPTFGRIGCFCAVFVPVLEDGVQLDFVISPNTGA
jgi:hypothetical protein